MQIFHRLGHVVGGTLLIAATTIGVGMLALPVATAPLGFGPSVLMYLLTWGFMLCTGLLMLEVCTWMPKDANFITMTQKLMGPVGKGFCWVIYLFLFVTVMIAHVAGAGKVLFELAGGHISLPVSILIYVALFSPFIYFGTRMIDRLNLILMGALVLLFLSFVAFSAHHVNTDLLAYSDWSKAWFALPILLTAFTYQLIIPTLMTYMDRNVKKVRLTIILGSSIPLIVYLVWEFLILGIVPLQGESGLLEAAKLGVTAVMPLKKITGDTRVSIVGNWFAFCVFTTSYLTFSLAFLDFLADGLKMKKVGVNKIALCLMVFVPPTVVSLVYPKVFLTMLTYAGGISCAVLFGLFPPLMAWMGRYVRKTHPKGSRQLPGGKAVLAILMIFVALEVVLEIAEWVL